MNRVYKNFRTTQGPSSEKRTTTPSTIYLVTGYIHAQQYIMRDYISRTTYCRALFHIFSHLIDRAWWIVRFFWRRALCGTEIQIHMIHQFLIFASICRWCDAIYVVARERGTPGKKVVSCIIMLTTMACTSPRRHADVHGHITWHGGQAVM